MALGEAFPLRWNADAAFFNQHRNTQTTSAWCAWVMEVEWWVGEIGKNFCLHRVKSVGFGGSLNVRSWGSAHKRLLLSLFSLTCVCLWNTRTVMCRRAPPGPPFLRRCCSLFFSSHRKMALKHTPKKSDRKLILRGKTKPSLGENGGWGNETKVTHPLWLVAHTPIWPSLWQ